MAKFVPLSQVQHREMRWTRFSSYRFAENETFIPLVAADLARTVLNMPIGFIERDGRLLLVAVTSLQPGINLFVSVDGQWLGGYVPSALRGYPFRLLPVKGRSESVLAFDEESGLIGQGEPFSEGEPLFGEDGKPARLVGETLGFLRQCERSRLLTERAVAAIADSDIIEDWPVSMKTEQGERKVTGLKRVSETKLNALDDAPFLALRKAAALPIIYAHLLSLQNLSNFDRIVRLRDQMAAAKAAQNAQPAWQMAAEDELLF